MSDQGADFSLTFRRLSDLRLEDSEGNDSVRALFEEPEAFDRWAEGWRARLRADGTDEAARVDGMRSVNPLFIPRNHRVQQAIDALVENADSGPFEDLLAVTARPFEEDFDRAQLAAPPEPHEVVRQTFCGT